MTQENEMYAYQPGTCNLGKVETIRRFRLGFIGLGSMVLIAILVEVLHLPRPFRFVLFMPAFYAFSGFLQGYKRFCYVYGFKGVMSLTGRKKFQHVTEDSYLKKDRQTAIAILSATILCSITITAIYFFLPF